MGNFYRLSSLPFFDPLLAFALASPFRWSTSLCFDVAQEAKVEVPVLDVILAAKDKFDGNQQELEKAKDKGDREAYQKYFERIIQIVLSEFGQAVWE